ncbi:hypothetical protein K3H43_15965 [Aeromonas veronii]|jgi:hypothetical protein|uniref:hypothetical protein n=1 Tax=Aeromonas TaxID=642 RepID=UPI0018A3EBEE|nr:MULTISPECIES: hypothetical protein [Aeromonas]QWL60652.1 hypothetical protein HQ400_21515 [Aeromonas jandaei]MCF5728858.1 hypothetical protein [Aeromonas veronii]MDM5057046.1 hypothetical protein [Aeromonas dhakensis]MDM5083194.1 hypothetical protein [Aeromonas dhakensis]BCM78016.1 hypothetical protein KAM329_45680 [Aeromonas caviae]
MNALDKALASLELDDVVPATGVTSADADLDALEALLEAPEATADAVDASPVEVAEAVTEALSEDVAADAQIDALGADLDDLDALLGSDVAFPTSTIEEVAQELAMVETREELYAETDADAAGAADLVVETEAAPAESEKPAKIKARAHGASKPSAALIARLGSVEAVEAHLHIDASDGTLSRADLSTLIKSRMEDLDSLPKKVGEKAVNLIAHIAGGAGLSCYTRIALEMLLESGELTSKALYERYKARPYSEGTSRSQCGQLMQLLPAMGIAERPVPGSLVLIKDSPIAESLRSLIGKAA